MELEIHIIDEQPTNRFKLIFRFHFDVIYDQDEVIASSISDCSLRDRIFSQSLSSNFSSIFCHLSGSRVCKRQGEKNPPI